jgi:hypothetical protein
MSLPIMPLSQSGSGRFAWLESVAGRLAVWSAFGMEIPVCIECGRRLASASASAVDWPGWCRSGRCEEAAAVRTAVSEVLAAARSGEPLGGVKGWPARYAARRIAWHALDHAWEIEDRS